MTTTTHLYPIDNERRKGFYVAKLTGPDSKYVVAREFLNGRKKGSSWEYTPDDIGQLPAWILRAGGECNGCGRPDPKQVELVAAHAHGWQTVGMGFSSPELLKIWESGAPTHNPDEQVTAAIEPEKVEMYAADLPVPF